VTGTSVVTVLHNSADDLAACLDAVPAEMELVVVDNGSSDGGAEIARAARPDAKVILSAENRGFGAGCNRGAREGAGEVMIFLNPDTRALPGALERLAAAAAAEPDSIFGPALQDARGRPRVNARRRSHVWHEVAELLPAARRWRPAGLSRDRPAGHRVYSDGGSVDYLQGACLAVARRTLEAVGGFDETFFIYSEEEDLCERIARRGGRCVYDPLACVRHIGETSSSKTGDFATFHLYRSRVMLYRKRGERSGRASAALLALAVRLTALWDAVPLGRAARGAAWRRAALAGLRSGLRADVRPPEPWCA